MIVVINIAILENMCMEQNFNLIININIDRT